MSAPDAGTPPASDAGPIAIPDGSVAAAPEVDPGAPDAGDLDLLTSVPPAPPPVDTTCDASSAPPAPPGHHAGACRILAVENQGSWVMTSTTRRTYSTNGVETERRDQWGASSDGKYSDYNLALVENTWDAQGRAERSVQRQWYLNSASATDSTASWSAVVYGYGPYGYSAYTWSAQHYAGQAPFAPRLSRQQNFVVDSRGTAIVARDYWPDEGNDKVVAITLHPNGVEASESWDGMFCPYCHESAETALFDDAGNPLRLDTLYARAGQDKSHVVYSYEQGRLIGRSVDNGHYSTWDGNPLLSAVNITETYSYEAAQLKAMDSTENDAKCTIVGNEPSYTSDCTWTAGPQLHTAYGYDAAGNLASRVVTDASGNELSRYTAVTDSDGNLLCESQASAGVVQLFHQYDYSCW